MSAVQGLAGSDAVVVSLFFIASRKTKAINSGGIGGSAPDEDFSSPRVAEVVKTCAFPN